jgi:hypothetical protein
MDRTGASQRPQEVTATARIPASIELAPSDRVRPAVRRRRRSGVPAGRRPGCWSGVRRDVTTGQLNADPRVRRRRTLHPDQRALDELPALAATRSLRPTKLEVSTPAGRHGRAPVPPPHAGREPGQCLPADSVTTGLLSNRPRKEGRRCAASSQQTPTRCSQPGPAPGAEP